jgi:hypothetical protein
MAIASRDTPPAAGSERERTVPSPGAPSHVSGVRPATRAATADSPLVSALAKASSGRLVESSLEGASGSELSDFASALPELLRAPAAGPGAPAELGHTSAAGVLDLVLVSPRHIHVAQRLPDSPELVLVSVAPRSMSIGSVLSETRARLGGT